MKHVSLDIETLSTNCGNAVITQIGAVVFDDMSGVIEARSKVFFRALQLYPQTQELDRVIDESTLRWWFDQAVKFNRSPFGEMPPCNPATAMQDFFRFLRDNMELDDQGRVKGFIWCNGTDFDASNVKNMGDFYYENLPWKHNTFRDMRSLITAAEYAGIPEMTDRPRGDDIPHNALLDASNQAASIIYYINALRRFKVTKEALDAGVSMGPVEL